MSAALEAERDIWDVVVIGGGPPGENAAQYATQFSGLRAVLVEQELVGGECSYWACMPSKALLRPVELLAAARRVPGLVLGEHALDPASVLAHRDAVVNHHDDSSQVKWALGAGIDVVRGRGRIAGTRRVEVTAADGSTRVLNARHAVVLDTGSRPAIPDVPGLAAALPWTSRDVTNLHEIPRRVLIVGGGVVACEAATWLLGLGAEQVVMVVRGDALLARNEPFAGELVAAALSAGGAQLRYGEELARVARTAVRDTGEGRIHGGALEVRLASGDTITVDEIVVAAGRHPNSEDIGLETVGLAPGGPVHVDDQMTVRGVPGEWLYAVGDVCGRAQLTHMGKYQARVAGDVIAQRASGKALDGSPLGRHRDVADHEGVPQVTFTDPAVAAVGHTEQSARRAGFSVETVEYDVGAVAGASLLGDGVGGRAKLVIDAPAERLLGATFVGAGAAELVHAATIAVVARVPLGALWHAVPSYPTVSEIWLRLLEEHDRRKAGARP